MDLLRPKDLLDIAQYERVREKFRLEMMELKKRRRVSVGDRISLIFENQKTVLFQIQEMMRAERIVDPDKIQAELDIYNALLPSGRDLSATLFIEIEQDADIKSEIDRFQGLDRDDSLFLELPNGSRSQALFEPGHSKEDRISAVHYVRFPLTRDQIEAIRSDTGDVRITVQHPAYRVSISLNPDVRRSLSHDFE